MENVIGRVTGGQQSLIDGQIRSEMPKANMYLLNPSGVMFGPNATLDVNGSFHVSTADYLKLGDNGRFDATTPSNSVLTSAPPAAFGFLSSNPAPIAIQGSSLQVPEGKTLSVVGGDLQITGGKLSAPGGQLNLASVASAGEVIPTVSEQGPDLKLEGFGRLGKIEASQGAHINTDGEGGGSVLIRGGRLVVDNATISSNTQGNVDGARVGVDAQLAEDVVITNAGRVETTTLPNSTGNGGSTELKVKQLTLTDGARIDTSTNGSGQGGALSVTATDSVSISGRDSKGAKSGLFSNALGTGDGGKVSVSASTLTMADRGTIDAHTAGDGNAGDVEVQVGTLTLTGGAQIQAGSGIVEYKDNVFTSSGTGGPGRGGNLTVTATESISLSGGDSDSNPSGLFSNTVNTGDAGELSVSVPVLQLDGGRISSSTFGAGNAGNLDLQVGQLTLARGARISASVGEREIKDGLFTFIGTDSTGRGGKLTINATEAISIFGGSGTGYTTGIRTSSYGKGDAGTLSVSTPALLMTGEAFIGATTLGDGNAGNIDVQVGKLTLIGRALILTNIGVGQFKDAILGAASFGAGDAGNIQIHAAETFRSRNSVVTTASTQSGGGKINLSAGQIVELVDSQITTTVQGGAGDAGNITIDPRYVILNDSQVIARAVAGNGGNINIGADVFIASPTSVVDASSQKGVSGTIDIRGVVNNLSGSLVPLPQGYLNITALSEDRCAGRLREGRVSSFVVAGREGMPLQPGGVLPSPLYDTVGKLQDVHLHPFALSVAATAAESKSGLRLRCVQNDTRANRR